MNGTNTNGGGKIEAYGVKGLGSKPWRRTFKNAAAMVAWCEKNDATTLGVREVEVSQ